MRFCGEPAVKHHGWPSAVRNSCPGENMLIAKVVGTLVSTRKEESLENLKFLVLKQIDPQGTETGAYVIAADAVGAGVGEVVLYATGSSARQTVMTDRRPCDAVVMAIVDLWDVDEKIKYHKYGRA